MEKLEVVELSEAELDEIFGGHQDSVCRTVCRCSRGDDRVCCVQS